MFIDFLYNILRDSDCSNQKCCLKVLTANCKDVLNTLRIVINSYILVIQSIFIIIKNYLIDGFNVTGISFLL